MLSHWHSSNHSYAGHVQQLCLFLSLSYHMLDLFEIWTWDSGCLAAELLRSVFGRCRRWLIVSLQECDKLRCRNRGRATVFLEGFTQDSSIQRKDFLLQTREASCHGASRGKTLAWDEWNKFRQGKATEISSISAIDFWLTDDDTTEVCAVELFKDERVND